MAKGKKQYRVISGSNEIDQAQLLEMFQQLTGNPTKLDPEIVNDKYERLKNDIMRCNKLLLKFKEVILDRLITKRGVDTFFDREVNNLTDFAKRVDDSIDTIPNDKNLIYIYQELKNSFIIDEYLKVCKGLRRGEYCIKDRCNLSDRFIKNATGDELYIFDFAKSILNICSLIFSKKTFQRRTS